MFDLSLFGAFLMDVASALSFADRPSLSDNDEHGTGGTSSRSKDSKQVDRTAMRRSARQQNRIARIELVAREDQARREQQERRQMLQRMRRRNHRAQQERSR